MARKNTRSGVLAVAGLLTLLVMAGCACCNTACAGGSRMQACACGNQPNGWQTGWQNGYFGGPPTCFGYYSTCWRPWPADCCTCPSFAEILADPRILVPPVPLPPTNEVESVPAPALPGSAAEGQDDQSFQLPFQIPRMNSGDSPRVSSSTNTPRPAKRGQRPLGGVKPLQYQR